MPTRRRTFLAGMGALGAAALWPGFGGSLFGARTVHAMGPGSRFRIGELQIPGAFSKPRPSPVRRLLWEVEKSTSIEVDRTPLLVRPTTPDLHQSPFVMLAGDQAFGPLSPTERGALLRFIQAGGFLLLDCAAGRAESGFQTAAHQLVADLWPAGDRAFSPLPSDHVLYRSFFLLDHPSGRVIVSPQLEAVTHDQRIAILLSHNDLGGAWAREEVGTWTYECYPGGERQRDLAFRLGVNIVMYALCLDYKADQVHVPFLLKRRQWRP